MMAYDAARGKIVLFGGTTDEEFLSVNDTWEYDGSNWTQIETANTPLPRDSGAMIYDEIREKIVLFGGGSDDVRYNDMWEFDGQDWTAAETANAPEPRAGHAMVYDSARERILLFGGRTYEGRLNDTWEYADGVWSQIAVADSPSGRSPSLQTVYDSARDQVVIHGGLSAESTYLGDTWVFDGVQWIEREASLEGNYDPFTVTFTRDGGNGLARARKRDALHHRRQLRSVAGRLYDRP